MGEGENGRRGLLRLRRLADPRNDCQCKKVIISPVGLAPGEAPGGGIFVE